MADLINMFDKAVLGQVVKKVPFIENAEVTFQGDVSGDFGERLEAKTKELGDTDAGYWTTVSVISDWNFAGNDGKKLDITIENFKKLPMKVQRWLIKESSEILLTNDERKKG